MKLRFPRVSPDVHHEDIGGVERRQDEEVSLQLRVVMATGAHVPATVVELLSGPAGIRAVDHLEMVVWLVKARNLRLLGLVVPLHIHYL